MVHFLWAALFSVRGWHPPTILAAHFPTPLPTSPPSLVKIPALWFFQGWSPWGWYGDITFMILGRPYLLSPLRQGPGIFLVKVGNMSPSLLQKGRLLPQGPVLRGRAAQLPQVHEGSAWWVALNMIWHIYSHLHCSTGDGGMD